MKSASYSAYFYNHIEFLEKTIIVAVLALFSNFKHKRKKLDIYKNFAKSKNSFFVNI